MAYQLEGNILEVCNCNILCPCWVGEDPDNGTCDSVLAYHFDRGTIEGIDVSGLTLGLVAHIPGNVLKGNFRVVVVLDEAATPQQEEAILRAYTGKLGGPLADLSQLIGEVVAVEQASITFQVQEGKGTLKIGQSVQAEMEPYRGPTGQVTTLNESVFSTIPGSPAYIAKASRWRAKHAALGFDIDLNGHNAIQGAFRFEG
ncbi:MAG TPA: DUF1326 domain-containing protein [Dehalococcoidia bacterium]|nr:DUF1326 domain-containing protein [Dehalococcoidia bacterium]